MAMIARHRSDWIGRAAALFGLTVVATSLVALVVNLIAVLRMLV